MINDLALYQKTNDPQKAFWLESEVKTTKPKLVSRKA